MSGCLIVLSMSAALVVVLAWRAIQKERNARERLQSASMLRRRARPSFKPRQLLRRPPSSSPFSRLKGRG